MTFFRNLFKYYFKDYNHHKNYFFLPFIYQFNQYQVNFPKLNYCEFIYKNLNYCVFF